MTKEERWSDWKKAGREYIKSAKRKSPFRKAVITQEILKENVQYCPETGELKGISEKVFSLCKKTPYIIAYIDGITYYAHCLIWFYMTGKWEKTVDHIDGDGSNNKWINLRGVTQRENSCNKESHRNGRLVGAYFNKRSKRWFSCITICNKNKYIGSFNNEKEASLAYCRHVLKNKLVRREFLPEMFSDSELYGEDENE